MSDTQTSPTRPPSAPHLEVVPEPKKHDSGEVSIKLPGGLAGLVKWVRGNLALVVVCGYVGGDSLLQGYVSAPQDIQEIKAEIVEIKKEISTLTKAIEAVLSHPTSNPVKEER